MRWEACEGGMERERGYNGRMSSFFPFCGIAVDLCKRKRREIPKPGSGFDGLFGAENRRIVSVCGCIRSCECV